MNTNVANLYQTLTGGSTFNNAISSFQRLKINNYTDGDLFFQKFGVGNVIQVENLPYERFICYEALLDILKKIDEKKFYEMHKGTPYFYLCWLAFDLNNFEKALFYMDCAIGEDIRAVGDEWVNSPMAKFLTFELIGNPADRTVKRLRIIIEKLFGEYNAKLNDDLVLENFSKKFVIDSIKNDNLNRSIITGLYSFIVEKNELEVLINLRSIPKGTIEPWLIHLFKGGLLFESIVKLKFPKKDCGDGIITLGDLRYNSAFIKKYFSSDKSQFKTSANDLNNIIAEINSYNIKSIFSTTSKVRNVCGHNIISSDVFDNIENYNRLYEQIIYSILHFIKNEWL